MCVVRRRRQRQEHAGHDAFDLMGDYAVKVRSDLLVHAQGKEGAPSPDVAALRGRRLAIVSETEDGCSLSEARIKDIVSNEVIAARRLHRDPFTFRPTHKIILSTNHRPHVRGTDHGIWRRLAIVRFNATITEEAKVADFRERFLRPELPGILNWAVEGLMRWKRDGLRLPASVRATTAEYRSEMDTVGQWIEERAEKDPEAESTRQNPTWRLCFLVRAARAARAAVRGAKIQRGARTEGLRRLQIDDGARARRGLKLKPPNSLGSFCCSDCAPASRPVRLIILTAVGAPHKTQLDLFSGFFFTRENIRKIAKKASVAPFKPFRGSNDRRPQVGTGRRRPWRKKASAQGGS